jgi:hypothetical protein
MNFFSARDAHNEIKIASASAERFVGLALMVEITLG